MDKYQFEQQLDNLLDYMLNSGLDQAFPLTHLPPNFIDKNFKQYIAILISKGFIKPLSVNFQSGSQEFNEVVVLTPEAILFRKYSGFVAEAKQKRKEARRWNLETWKIGVDSLVAFLSLAISIIALIVSLAK